MKIIATLLAVTFLFAASLTEQKRTITASVTNVTSDNGKVSFALYDKESFMKKPLQAKSSKIVKGVSTVTFENVPPGEYAVICFHDKNDNDKMDFQPNGMPMEDYGTSNNVMTFGPPQYENSKFTVADKNVTLEIKF